VKNKENEQNGKSIELESLELMGIFLGIFGFIVGASAVLPENWTGRTANLLVGGLLLGIGIWCFLKGRTHRKQ